MPNPMASYQVENTRFPLGGQVLGVDREAMAMLTLPLEAVYQRGARVRGADALVRAAQADADATVQGTQRDAAHAFYSVARAEARLAAVADVAAWLDTVVAYNRTRVKEGVAAEADLIRVEVERDRATIEVASHRAELARARAALAVYAGTNGDAVTAEVPSRPLVVDSVAGRATGRAELRATAARVDAAEAAVSTERRNLIRELGATIGTKQMMGTTSMIAGISFPFPLFNQNRGEIGRAQAERDAERRELAAATRIASSEVDGATEAVRLLTEQLHRLGSADAGILARAEQAERIALGAYREGAVSLLQVLDASRARSEARVAYYDLLIDQHEAVIDLLYLSGHDIRSSLTRVNPDLR